MENLNSDIFQAFQNKLKVGNRRGVHLNAIPGNSRYKFDLARLSAIQKSLPEHFIIDLLTQKNFNFKFSVVQKKSTNDSEVAKKDSIYLFDDEDEKATESISEKLVQTESNEEGVLGKLTTSLENLVFQNDVIKSEKGVNSLGFGFPILIRKDMDGQISASPILIWSVKIQPLNELNTWGISRTEDDPIYMNEVLINHLQNDSGIILEKIPEEMLADGKIDKPELFSICETILRQLKITQNIDFLLSNYEEIPLLKSKISYENQLKEKGDAVILKSGLFSIFEVQKQNIINDYESLKKEFKPVIAEKKGDFQTITSIETDPSQQGILESLKLQSKILIQGPPGTGKSQTLTAVLMNALENKQKTIVVCEKQTALEVLYNALQKNGLQRYCVMIKDSVTDRRFVVDSVRNLIDSPDFKKQIQPYSSQSLETHLQELLINKGKINKIHHLLNTDLLPEKNYTEVVGDFLSYQNTKEDIDIRGLQFSFSEEEFNGIKKVFQNGEELYQNFRKFEGESFLNPQKLIAENFHASVQKLDESFYMYENESEEIKRLIANFKPVFDEKNKKYFAENLRKISSLIDEVEVMTSILNENSEEFHPEITNGFLYKFTAIFSTSKKKKISNQKRLIAIFAESKKISLDEFFPNLDFTDRLWNNKVELINYREKIQMIKNDFDSELEQRFNQFDYLNAFNSPVVGKETELISSKIQQLRKNITNEGWIKSLDFGSSYFTFSLSLNQLFDKYKSYRNHPENALQKEYNWFSYYLPLSNFQKEIVTKLLPVENWESSFFSVYFSLLLGYYSTSEHNFNEKNYEEFSKKLKQLGNLQKSFIEYFWSVSQQEAVKFFEKTNKDITVANLYNKRSSTNFKKLSLRQIVQKDIELFTSFFPVIFTTPDACSNLFQGKNFYFDNVVFDEASQLKLEDNLPALLKGKNIIISGDEHQMPPSSYFSKVFDGNIEDEDDIEAETEVITYKNALLNIESLLDFAMENQFEKKYLDFHYRSKHPYLIDFSNHAFYNSRLKPLPLKPKQKPIEFFQVDGIFDEHTNRKEAEKVLDILESIEPNSSGVYPSVGIATFNITQRNYIRRQILHKISLPENEAFKNKIQAFEATGFFIKNLENIQGDERDIIIVSTTYGKKPSGKFIQSFGPVNHTKGYKLLNVIITRAKEKIYICNSIPEDIFGQYKEALQQEGTNNRKAVFYAYLAYCKAVSEENDGARTEILKTLDFFGLVGKSAERLKDESFTNYVFDELKKVCPELKIHKNYHFGGYDFDILIETKNEKPIVVECMSKEKYVGNLAYIEDLHKEKVIKNAGFEYVRIWSQNSWQNLESEIQKIKNKLCYSNN